METTVTLHTLFIKAARLQMYSYRVYY